MEVRIIKGTKQIGGCITEISTAKTKIIIDFGEDLEGNDKFELEGLTKGKSIYDAVFITHSHGDHIGLINNINEDIDVYVEEKSLIIHNITSDFCNKEKITRNINTFNFDSIIKVGDIKITPYIVDHSAYNSCMYLIEAEGMKILHTGDYRNHGKKGCLFKKTLEIIGEVDLLITEGTSLSRSLNKYKSEYEIEKDIDNIMNNYNQVFIMQSSTNIDRTISFIRSSIKNHKKFIMEPFTYALNKEIGFNINVDYKNIFVWIPNKYKNKEDWFKDKYLNIETNSKFGKSYVMEVKSSMISDIKLLHKKGLINKACLIYSMWDGYIEKEEKLKVFLDECEKMGIDIIKLHTSGHADIETMKLLNEIVKPKKTLIIHTDDNSKAKDIFDNVEFVNDYDIIKL